MIVSKNGTSYDGSNGSEQPHAGSAEPRERSEREEINRWEDDGPGPHARAAASSADVQCKPAWSVLSLRNLLEAVRRLGREDDKPRSVGASSAAERDCLSAEQSPQEAVDAGADARRDRYRNHWENT